MTPTLDDAFRGVEAFNDRHDATWRLMSFRFRVGELAVTVKRLSQAAKKLDPDDICNTTPKSVEAIQQGMVDLFRDLVEVCEAVSWDPEDLANEVALRLKEKEMRLEEVE
ncbi:MAG: hypothetical protein KGI98_14900 [Euryarchaeota archaeon]|nr:hypothetical protein [Euryarchaeota archaeon]MDE1879456.1 hypothetical protein [Euryarchaeota archaeon]